MTGVNVSAVAARESARRPNGRFGEQGRLDPGQLGLDTSPARFDLGTVEGLAEAAAQARATGPAARAAAMARLHGSGLEGRGLVDERHRIGAGFDAARADLKAGLGLDPDGPHSEEQLARVVGAAVADHAQRVCGVDFDAVAGRAGVLEAEKEAINREFLAADRAVSELSARIGERVAASPAVTACAADRAAPGGPDRLREAVFDGWRADPQWGELEEARARAGALQAAYTAHDGGRCVDELTGLAEGYRQVLGRVRPLGGRLALHDKTSRRAAEAFAEAAEVLPADWVDASNAMPRPMLAKVSRSRAHYRHGHYQPTRRRVPDRTVTFADPGFAGVYDADPSFDMDVWTPESGIPDPGRGWRDTAPYVATSYQVHEQFGGAEPDPDRPPKGSGWQLWQHPTVAGHRVWRRPKMRVEQTGSDLVAEITTNARPGGTIRGNSPTFEVAVHELAHRSERAVQGVSGVEREFMDRRAGSAPQVRLYPGDPSRRGEVGRDGGFVDLYVGREYDGGGGEVLSCGVQALFGGAYGGLAGAGRYRPDPEHRDLVLGLLATAGGSGHG